MMYYQLQPLKQLYMSQDLWELKLNLLVLLSMYAMFILWMTLHVTQDVSPIT